MTTVHPLFVFCCLLSFLSCGVFRDIDEKDQLKSCPVSLEGRSWAYMRVGVRYIDPDRLSAHDSLLMRVIKERIFPVVSNFWSQAMSVRSVGKPLLFQRTCKTSGGRCVKETRSTCGARNGMKVEIPVDLLGPLTVYQASGDNGWKPYTVHAGRGAKADFVLLVSLHDHESCGDMDGGTIASAVACRWDECDRPTLGYVNICPRAVDPGSEESILSLFSTLAHEMTHVFGFTSDTLAKMRHIHGTPRIHPLRRKEVFYTCSIRDGVPSVRWNVFPSEANRGKLYKYVFPDGLVSFEERRGVGSRCRCPIDETVEYTSADIEHCLTHKHECVFVVKTPRVAALSRFYFGCPSLSGAELENQRSEPSCQIIESHWKQRLFGEEYMTATSNNIHGVVSPVTFAFLEDTGWYRMNYAMTTALVPGSQFGYKAGCDFVYKPCLSSAGVHVATSFNSKTFCDRKAVVCSADGTHKVDCNMRLDARGSSPPTEYEYPILGRRMDDYCPVYRPVPNGDCTSNTLARADSWEAFGKHSHCLDVTYQGRESAGCFKMECHNRGTEYSISFTSADGGLTVLADRCLKRNQIITQADFVITCLDPKVMCSMRDYAHIGNVHLSPSLPGAVLNSADRGEAQAISNRIYSKVSGQVIYDAGHH